MLVKNADSGSKRKQRKYSKKLLLPVRFPKDLRAVERMAEEGGLS